jgi:hypothetical protein
MMKGQRDAAVGASADITGRNPISGCLQYVPGPNTLPGRLPAGRYLAQQLLTMPRPD